MQREHHWRVEIPGRTPVATDDLTLDEVEIVERVCGDPWTLLNPSASARHAKALLVVLAMRAGDTEDQALERAVKTPLRQLKSAFVFVEGNAPEPGQGSGPAVPPSSAPTSATG